MAGVGFFRLDATTRRRSDITARNLSRLVGRPGLAKRRRAHKSVRHSNFVMNTTSHFPTKRTNWKVLYRAAILETNTAMIPQRISEAELAVLAREREIFYGAGDSEEKEALED